MNTAIAKKIFKFVQDSQVEAAYIPSFDEYMSEYVPKWNNFRYLSTGFTGSMGDALVTKDKIYLFVDGRYHLQADNEINIPEIEVIKLGTQSRLFASVFKKAQELGVIKLGIFDNRMPLGFQSYFQGFSITELDESIYKNVIGHTVPDSFPMVKNIDSKLLGQSVAERLERLDFESQDAYFLSAIDDVAWLTNMRGYHLSFLSSFLSKAIVTKDKIYLLCPKGVEFENLDEKLMEALSFNQDISEVLGQIDKSIKTINIDKSFCSIGDVKILKSKGLNVIEGTGLTYVKSVKASVELPAFERSFEKGDQAIFETISWLKREVSEGKKVSEFDLNLATSKHYKDNGALGQSFGTISGVGENGAIIHYSNPKKDRFITDTDLVLLDSGGYFEEGVATDTTRTFLSGKLKDLDHRKYFTYVLKAQIQAESAVFPIGTPGNVIAMLCDQVLFREGLEYNHGLGHGVGVHVHESGVGMSAARKFELKVGNIISIEPGLYFNHKFGIRHENISIVEKHPKFEGLLRFRNLVYVGIDPQLVDLSMLTDHEKRYYLEYQQECSKRGRSFT